jgi:hypothetical protein
VSPNGRPVGWLSALYQLIVRRPFPPFFRPRASCRSFSILQPAPNLHFAFSIPHRLVRQADCQSTLRGIDKPLHSFDVHLPLYLRCLNGSLGLFHSSLSRPTSKFVRCFRLSTLTSVSFIPWTRRSINPSLTQSDGHYGDIIGVITHVRFHAHCPFCHCKLPLPQPPPSCYLRKASTSTPTNLPRTS